MKKRVNREKSKLCEQLPDNNPLILSVYSASLFKARLFRTGLFSFNTLYVF